MPNNAIDDFLGTTSESEDADSFLGIQREKPDQSFSGPVSDAFFQTISPIHRVMSAFGQGIQDGWGSIPNALGTDDQTALKKAGIKDFQEHHDGEAKSFNEAFIRPAVHNLFWTPFMAGAALLGGLGEAGTQVGSELVRSAKEAQEHPEQGLVSYAMSPITGEAGQMAQAVSSGEYFGEGLPGEDSAANRLRSQELNKTIDKGVSFNKKNPSYLDALTRARAEGKLGEGDIGYYNTRPPSEENLKARAAAAQQIGTDLPEIKPPQNDIESLVRQIDPYTFQEHDRLTELRQSYQDDISRLSQLRGKETEDKILTLLAQSGGDETNLSEFQFNKLKNLREQLTSERAQYSPEMAKAQQRLVETDYQLRDLIPDTSAAYDYAKELMPEEAKESQDQWFKDAQKVAVEPEPPTAPQKPVQTQVEAIGSRVAGQAIEAATGLPTGSGERLLLEVQGTGETRTRGLSANIEAKGVEKGITDSFGDLPQYQQVQMADQAKKAVDLITSDWARARRIAMGEETAPEGIFPESVLVAVEKQAILNKDVNTLRELASGRLSTESTIMGQRLRTLAERDSMSPMSVIKEVQDARKEELSKGFADRSGKLAQAQKKEVTDIKTSIKNTASDTSKWEEFIKSIECDY